MRKIEEQMVKAIFAKRNFKKDNTQVVCDGDDWTVYLYGNKIAQCTDNELQIDGYNTYTTCSRLNALFEFFGLKIKAHIKQGATLFMWGHIPLAYNTATFKVGI